MSHRSSTTPGSVEAGQAEQIPPNRWLSAALELDGWMSARDYAGYDPHDLLNSPIVRPLTFGSRWLAVAWTQLGRRSPVQLRRLLLVPRVRNAKAIGLALATHARLAAAGRALSRARAREFVTWLGANAARDYSGPAWGYPFPWANRDFRVAAGTPSSVVTAFVAHGLLDAADRCGFDDADRLGTEAAEFIRRDLNRREDADGTCFSYTPRDRRAVHNANLLAASLLARVAARTGDEREGALAADALAAARYTLSAQRPDGSWPYGVGRRNAWVDSFHTSYSLVALHGIGCALGGKGFGRTPGTDATGGTLGPGGVTADTDALDAALERGIDYWRGAFFDGPAVSYHPHESHPIDTHAVAHAILTLVVLRHRIPAALETAARLADWCLEEMRDPAGWFHYRRYRLGRNRLAYMRWVQAWMLRALVELGLASGDGSMIGEGDGDGVGVEGEIAAR